MNVRENWMGNPETLATLGKQEPGQRLIKKNHITYNSTDKQHAPHQNPGMNTGASEGK